LMRRIGLAVVLGSLDVIGWDTHVFMQPETTPPSGVFPTPYLALNAVLVDLVHGARSALAESFVGAYLQGSFAVAPWGPLGLVGPGSRPKHGQTPTCGARSYGRRSIYSAGRASFVRADSRRR